MLVNTEKKQNNEVNVFGNFPHLTTQRRITHSPGPDSDVPRWAIDWYYQSDRLLNSWKDVRKYSASIKRKRGKARAGKRCLTSPRAPMHRRAIAFVDAVDGELSEATTRQVGILGCSSWTGQNVWCTGKGESRSRSTCPPRPIMREKVSQWMEPKQCLCRKTGTLSTFH